MTIDGGSVTAAVNNVLSTAPVINGGTLLINGSNAYTGGTTVTAGSVMANANNALGTGPVNVNGGSLVINGANAYAGGTTVNAGSVTAGVNNALGTGPVTVNGGSVTANTDAALGSGLLSVAAGGTVNFLSANPSLNGLSDGAVPGSGGSIVLGNATTPAATNLTIISNAPSTFSGVISDISATNTAAAGSLVKAGSSTLTLAGNGFSTFTGGTTISAGTLVATAAALGSGPLHILNGSTFSPVAAVGMNAQYFGPNITGFNSMTSSSLITFNTVYLAGAHPCFDEQHHCQRGQWGQGELRLRHHRRRCPFPGSV